MHVSEILIERLSQTMTTGSARDIAMIVQMYERYLPDALASKAEALATGVVKITQSLPRCQSESAWWPRPTRS